MAPSVVDLSFFGLLFYHDCFFYWLQFSNGNFVQFFSELNVLSVGNLSLILFMLCVTERRQAEANRIREKYPDRIPVSSFFPFMLFASFL